MDLYIPSCTFYIPSCTFISLHAPLHPFMHLLYPFMHLYIPSYTFISLHAPLYPFMHLYIPSCTFISLHAPLHPFMHLYIPSCTFISLHAPLYPFMHLIPAWSSLQKCNKNGRIRQDSKKEIQSYQGGVRQDHVWCVFAESAIIFPIDFAWKLEPAISISFNFICSLADLGAELDRPSKTVPKKL